MKIFNYVINVFFFDYDGKGKKLVINVMKTTKENGLVVTNGKRYLIG